MKNESAELKAMRDQRDRLAVALRKIMNAHNSGNNGAYMGEARVCQAFAAEANAVLASIERERQATISEFMGLAPYPDRS